MHLFASLGASSSPSIESINDKPLPVEASANGEHSTVIRIGQHSFALPQSVTSKSAFQKSRLGAAITSSRTSPFELSDGSTIRRSEFGELIISRPQEKIDDFRLLISHLLGRKPLEVCTFRNIATVHERLLNEVKLWSLPKDSVELPYRLWTRSRWTDLAGVYVLNREDRKLLKCEPVAIQLEDGTVQGVRILAKHPLFGPRTHACPTETYSNEEKITAAAAKEDALKMVHSDGDVEHILGLYYWADYRVVLMSTDRVTQADQSFNDFVTSLDTPATPQSTSPIAAAVESISSPSSAATTNFSSPSNKIPTTTIDMTNQVNVCTSIFIKIPNSDKVVAYDLPKSDRFEPPNGRDFPLFYRRGDRHIFSFSSSFSLEVQELKDAVSGLCRIRCGLSRVGLEPKSITTSSQGSGGSNPSSLIAGLFKGASGGSTTKKDAWQCFHPVLSVRYAPTLKHIKEFGEVSRIQFYPWGSLVTHVKADSPLAILSIDHPEKRKIFGDRILVYIRGFPHSVFTREDIDITVTPALDRVYLICCSQVSSVSITPQSSRIDFEIQEGADKKFRLRLVHIDIPEGAPKGKNLGWLRCVGLLSEFRPKTGLYYQDSLCKYFCPRYSGASPNSARSQDYSEKRGSQKTTKTTVSESQDSDRELTAESTSEDEDDDDEDDFHR